MVSRESCPRAPANHQLFILQGGESPAPVAIETHSEQNRDVAQDTTGLMRAKPKVPFPAQHLTRSGPKTHFESDDSTLALPRETT